MNGMNAVTGEQLTGIEHLRQSVCTILTTPIGTRVMRRDFGSRLFELLDKPLNDSTVMAIRTAVTSALQDWEPRFRLHRTDVVTASGGKVTLDLRGEYLLDGVEVILDGIEVN